ncbi:MAG: SMP-30/gluconolactonase/LRE family protein [Kiritimatiellae bacterium]|nr:SMP-30/gluconolactonase/LRE family protein [Kiritimatiellia bacterium]
MDEWKHWILTAIVTAFAAAPLAAEESEPFVVRDPAEFHKIVPAGATLRKLADGMQFVEGPVWVARAGGFLLFSDIPADEIKKWTTEDGLATFRKPSRQANGNILDLQGRLLTCEHLSRSVTRTEENGTVTTLADRFQGNRLNSPNDIAVKSDATIWFTDPPYGLKNRGKELAGNYVFRLDPFDETLRVAADDFDRPNGLCFSPDEKRLYIADSGKPRHIRLFDVGHGGVLGNGRVFCTIETGAPDGIRCDSDGRVFSSAGDGIHIYAPDGKLIGKIRVPETPANLCFGGATGSTLFITARRSLYAITLNVTDSYVRRRTAE